MWGAWHSSTTNGDAEWDRNEPKGHSAFQGGLPYELAFAKYWNKSEKIVENAQSSARHIAPYTESTPSARRSIVYIRGGSTVMNALARSADG